MQDSLQLPQELDSVHTLLSPTPQARQSRQNTPPHSLAYSNSTCAKDRMQDIQIRSPFGFDQLQADSPSKLGVIKANNQNYPINQQYTVSASPVKRQEILNNIKEFKDKPAAKGQYRKLKPKVIKDSKSPQKSDRISPNLNQANRKTPLNSSQPKQKAQEHFQQRKTLQKSENTKTNKRIKQLQQALHIQTVLSEELRTKLSVTKGLLETAMRENGLGYVFNLKNSSRDMKNVDIFIQLTTLQKSLNEKCIMIDRLKDQLKEMNLSIETLKLKKGGSPTIRSPNRTLNDQIQKLIQQKQSLMSYIDEQKAILKRKIEYIAQLEQEVNRIGDKQAHYTNVQRPKLITELSLLKLKNKELQEATQTMQMEFNLTQLKLTEENQQLRHKVEKLQQTLIKQDRLFQSIEKQPVQKPTKSTSIQTEDLQRQKLIQELTLLKKQRDHYYIQYQKRTEESAKFYALQLKMSLIQEQTRSQS